MAWTRGIMEHRGLPQTLYSAAEVRALDRAAIERHGIPGGVLMRRAAQAALDVLLASWPDAGTLHICCGTGNNGGDGFVMAALARARGLPVRLWQVGPAGRIGGDAKRARETALADGIEVQPLTPATAAQLQAPGVIVDAMLGTGLDRAVRGPFVEAVAAINASGLPVLAVDIPSGLCSDSGRVLGCAVRADVTVSFIGLKRGLFTAAGPEFSGKLYFDDLRVPAEVYRGVPASARLLDLEPARDWLAPRPRTAHKGAFGHVLVIGGDRGMAGAAMMAAQAATRVGAGLVSCATRAAHAAALTVRCPEVMARGTRCSQELAPMLEASSVVVIGPGLGRAAWGEQLLHAAWQSERPLVVDADALNLLAVGVVPPRRAASWIMTPHPGEAARLLGMDTVSVQADRFAAARLLAERYGAVVILKGAGTLVFAGESAGASRDCSGAGSGMRPAKKRIPGICRYGNPGMASGGMGDVLSGVLGGLLAQRLPMPVAAELGVCLHGAAADRAASDGERGMVATDLLVPLRSLVNAY